MTERQKTKGFGQNLKDQDGFIEEHIHDDHQIVNSIHKGEDILEKHP